MKPEVYEQGEVDVEGELDTFYRQKKFTVIDYAFIDKKNTLLLMSGAFDKGKLLLLDEYGDKELESELPEKPEGIKRDRLGNIHFKGNDNYYQIHISDTAIVLFSKTAIKRFNKNFSSCVTKVKDKVVFEKSLIKHGTWRKG